MRGVAICYARASVSGACALPSIKSAAHSRTGTPAGYRAHLRYGDTPCAACSAAETARVTAHRRTTQGGARRRARDRARYHTPSGKATHTARTARYYQQPAARELRRERHRRRKARLARGHLIPAHPHPPSDTCVCCGTDEHITTDHIIPLDHGGAHHPQNCQPLCLSCNSSRGTAAACGKHGTHLAAAATACLVPWAEGWHHPHPESQ